MAHYACISHRGDEKYNVGSGSGDRYHRLMRAGRAAILKCATAELAQLVVQMVKETTNQPPNEPDSVRSWDDPMLHKWLTFFASWSSQDPVDLIDIINKAPSKTPRPETRFEYSVASFMETLAIRESASDHPLLRMRLTYPDRNRDRTTQHMLRIQQQHLDAPDSERLFNLMWHRAFSNIPVIDAFGWVQNPAEAREAIARVFEVHPRSAPAPFNHGTQHWTPERLIERGVEAWDTSRFLHVARTTRDPATTLQFLRRQHWSPFTGNNSFSAFQVVLDMMELVPELQGHRTHWAEFRVRGAVGKRGGAKMKPEECFASGAAILLAKGYDPRPYTSDSYWVARAKERGEPYGQKPGWELTLRLAHEIQVETGIDIVTQEHWWCEHSKIMRMQARMGNLRLYTPRNSCTCCGHDKPFLHPSAVAFRPANPL